MKTSTQQPRDIDQLSRRELLPVIVEAGLCCVERWGVEEKLDGVAGPVLTLTDGPLSIIYTTPQTMAPGATASFGIDIWYENKKTFSAWRNSLVQEDFQLIAFKRGPWIILLLEMAARTGEPPRVSRRPVGLSAKNI
ncbi:MAG: hypothetical protein JSS31_10230 [Proteobacteria bacterium]|nr:hypothetical protein [Pseudomonadota bacterium]